MEIGSASAAIKPLKFNNQQWKEIRQMQTLTDDKIQEKAKSDNFKQGPIVVPPDASEKLNLGGSQIFHKVKSKDTNGAFSVVEIVTPPGKGLDLHVHECEDELVYLLEGEIEVTLGNQKMKAVSGVLALLPRGIPHGFTNIGNRPSRLLDTILPGQFDNYFVEFAALVAAREPSQDQIDGLSKTYRIRYL